ncbi:hypothetical protein B566_EDAN009421 [Ephemera danica]|nr:hypothetical protein B566_EDAN009421 [Ephemera danica]
MNTSCTHRPNNNAKARLKRRVLTEKDLDAIRDATPPLKKGSSHMFRNLRDKGQSVLRVLVGITLSSFGLGGENVIKFHT